MNCPKCKEAMTHQGKPEIIYKHKIAGTPETIAAGLTSALAVGLEYERNEYYCPTDDISIVIEIPFASPSQRDCAKDPETASIGRLIKGNFLARQLREKPMTPGEQRELEDFKTFCQKESITIGDCFMEYGSGDLPAEQRPLLQKAITASKGNMLIVSTLGTLSTRASVINSIFAECERQEVQLKILRGAQTAEQLLNLMDSPDYQ